MLASATQASAPRRTFSPYKIVLAESDPVVRGWLKPILRRLAGEQLIEVDARADLERLALESRAGIKLIITNARLQDHSTLRTLALARANGTVTPFIVYTSFEDALMRVLVSDVAGTVLSSRIVDVDSLGELAERLLRDGDNSTHQR